MSHFPICLWAESHSVEIKIEVEAVDFVAVINQTAWQIKHKFKVCFLFYLFELYNKNIII